MAGHRGGMILQNKVRGFPVSGVWLRMNDEVRKTSESVYGPVPAPGVPVQVQCIGFKCMAYRDKDGNWMDFFTRKFLTGVLGVVPA
jgi:hypothetical protein